MEKIEAKQKRVLELMPHIAKCVDGKAIMIGGTALSLFYLNHRNSIDIDLAVESNDEEFSRTIKGCLSKIGYEAKRTTYTNVFTVNFPETAVRIEVFIPPVKIKEFNEFPSGNAIIKVASLSSIIDLKIAAYKDRKIYRDLFDIWAIFKHEKKSMDGLIEVIEKYGLPIDDKSYLSMMNISKEDIASFLKVIKHDTS